MAFFYFAYGSNMSLGQMRERCPDCDRIGIGHLPGHRLVFPRFSQNRQCGVAGLQPHVDQAVWGVIYRLSPADRDRLDRFEGYHPERHPDHNNYNRIAVTIHATEPHVSRVTCFTYAATHQGGHFPPSGAYHSLMLDGARENVLPDDYVIWLEGIAILDEGCDHQL